MKNLVNWIKENKFMFGVLSAIVIMVGIAIYTFLFTKEDDEGAITGLQALQQQTGEFWVWAIGLTVLSAVGMYFIVKYIKSMGGYGVSPSIFIPIIIFIAIAWGKACTDKVNDGVTAGKGRPVPAKIDSTRMSAEDIIKSQNPK